jgi:hypothetical protein
MKTTAKGGQAKPEPGNATSFNWCFFAFNLNTASACRFERRGIIEKILSFGPCRP